MSRAPLQSYTPPSREANPTQYMMAFVIISLLLPVVTIGALFLILAHTGMEPFFGPVKAQDLFYFCMLPALVLLGWAAWAWALVWLVRRHHLSLGWLFGLLLLLL